jgi:Tfp pilus assembly protein PilF
VRWFHEATGKRRYAERYKPFLNLGHLHLERDDPEEALACYVNVGRIRLRQEANTRPLGIWL